MVSDIVTVPLRQVSEVRNPALPYKVAWVSLTLTFKSVWIPIVPRVGTTEDVPFFASAPPSAPLPVSDQVY